MNTYTLAKLVSSTCILPLTGSVPVRDYCRQGRVVTDSLELGGDDGVGGQKRDISPSAQEGLIFRILGKAH